MNILIWVLIWYGAFAGYYLLFKKKNILYKNSPKIIVGWYAIVSAIGIVVYHVPIGQALLRTTKLSFFAGIFIILITVFLWYKSLVRRSYVELDVSRNIFISKTAEIIFQQIMVWALYGMLQGVLLFINPLVLFAFVFFIIHLPLMYVIPWKKGLFFAASSIIGGLFFAVCLNYIPSGWLLALALHIGFYIAVATKRKIFGMDTFYVM